MMCENAVKIYINIIPHIEIASIRGARLDDNIKGGTGSRYNVA